MENLVPRQAYDIDETGFWKRMPIVVGLFFSIAMAVFFIIPVLWNEWDPSRSSELLLRGIAADVLGGIAAGLGFRFLFKRSSSSITDKLYYGDPGFDVPLAPGHQYEYRLPCGWAKTSTTMVGGVLYLGKSGLIFVPHKRNPAKNRVVTEIAPLHAVGLGLTYPKMSWFVVVLTRLFIPVRQPALEITWPAGPMTLRVPNPSETLTVINAKIAELLA